MRRVPDGKPTGGLKGREAEEKANGGGGEDDQIGTEKHGCSHRKAGEDAWTKRVVGGGGGEKESDGQKREQEKGYDGGKRTSHDSEPQHERKVTEESRDRAKEGTDNGPDHQGEGNADK